MVGSGVMTVDDRENPSEKRIEGSTPEQDSVIDALQSKTDEPLPPIAEAIAERDAARKHPLTPQGRRRRYLTRRNAVIAGLAIGVGAVALIFILFILYRLGFADRYVAGQIRNTFANYGIRAEIKDFHASITPQSVEMLGVELYDAQTGDKLGKIDRLLASGIVERRTELRLLLA